MGEFSVLVHSERTLSHVTERTARITMCESNATREITIILIRSWKANKYALYGIAISFDPVFSCFHSIFSIYEFSNISNIVGIGHNIIHTVNRLATKNMIGPIIFNCATNGERTGLTAITVAALQALQYKQPVIASEWCCWTRTTSGSSDEWKCFFFFALQMLRICGREFAHNEKVPWKILIRSTNPYKLFSSAVVNIWEWVCSALASDCKK